MTILGGGQLLALEQKTKTKEEFMQKMENPGALVTKKNSMGDFTWAQCVVMPKHTESHESSRWSISFLLGTTPCTGAALQLRTLNACTGWRFSHSSRTSSRIGCISGNVRLRRFQFKSLPGLFATDPS